MTDALVVTLASDLEHAATALDVVDDEARQHIASLLSPKARQLLATLTAADHAPPPPTAVTAPPIAVAPPSASALPPTNDSADERPTARPRPASGLQAFPEDVLGGIVSFVDLPMRFTCVVACRALRDAAAKLSPRLEHALVLKKFPLLRPVVESPQGAPAPRDLFRTFSGFGGERPPGPEPTETLDAYTLLLELYVVNNHSDEKKSVFVGTATLAPEATTHTPSFNFTIPGSVWEEVDDLTNGAWNLKARVVAMRRVGGRLQFADLFCGGVDDWEDDGCVFEYLHMPSNYENKGLDWQIRKNDAHDMYCQPELRLYWNCEPDRFSMRMSRLEVLFAFWTENGTEEMSLTDACLCLEHYVGWSE